MALLWLQMKSTAPGLPGPILEENKAAYCKLHLLSRMVLIFGCDILKQSHFDLTAPEVDAPGVFLHEDNCKKLYLADCRLHEITRPKRLRARVSTPNITTHCLQTSSRSNRDISWSLYANILVPLSASVVVCVDGPGALAKNAKMMADWVCRFPGMQGIDPHPRLLVASRQNLSKNQLAIFYDETLCRLRDLNPAQPPTFADAKNLFLSFFEGIYSLKLSSTGHALDQLSWHVNEIFTARQNYAPRFSAGQYEHLFNEASSYILTSSPIHVLKVFQSHGYKLGQDLRRICKEHTKTNGFHQLKTSVAKRLEALSCAVASHLAKEASSLRQISCEVETIYDILYSELVHQLEASFSMRGLTAKVHNKFCWLVKQYSSKPPTANVRVLVLSAPEATSTLYFLKKLRDNIFGNLLDYFDLVIGGHGAVVPVTQVFLEGQSISDSYKSITQKKWSVKRTVSAKRGVSLKMLRTMKCNGSGRDPPILASSTTDNLQQ
ncbi:hypothetical protein BX600DRAFT_493753 [Xylariales sp. PMI_506]|nr:hypothetical protein BX600DRAFT_493753 [Xylariales sp. PMI_506]